MFRLILLAAIGAALYLWLGGSRRALPPAVGRWLVIGGAVLLGFLYLRSPIDLIPDGTGPIGFVDDLLVLLSLLWWVQRRLPPPQEGERREPPPPRSAGAARWDPYAVLGVARGAPADEIAAAYRRRMKEYHPDRVSGLGDELQRVAHEKTLEIQRAYDELKRASARS